MKQSRCEQHIIVALVNKAKRQSKKEATSQGYHTYQVKQPATTIERQGMEVHLHLGAPWIWNALI